MCDRGLKQRTKVAIREGAGKETGMQKDKRE